LQFVQGEPDDIKIPILLAVRSANIIIERTPFYPAAPHRNCARILAGVLSDRLRAIRPRHDHRHRYGQYERSCYKRKRFDA